MGYLNVEQIEDISDKVELVQCDKISNIENLNFECGVPEYNEFLSQANAYSNLNISKTHLLFDKVSKELIGYIALANDTLRLSSREKIADGLKEVPFLSIPALKVGKLAVNKHLENWETYSGMGSFLLEMAKALALSMNENGIACRFLTVDADIEYDKGNTIFYEKNGFKINKSEVYEQQKKKYNTISMRMDILNDMPNVSEVSHKKTG